MNQTSERRHDLDALRAVAMLLGIALHAGLSFGTFGWIVQDSRTHWAFDLVVAAIHGFRMPMFFVVSGLFTAMLWRRRGL
ncbi:acyltransferase family protein, partial [Candidatus Woesearchaeota archaeon]|nr:acyltransferase family protein [Candidatus Woesearchaeota archaeon]